MAGVFTIAKKEFTDHVSDRTLLIYFGVLLVVMVGGGYFYVNGIQTRLLLEEAKGVIVKEDAMGRTNPMLLILTVIQPFTLLGVLAAISLSFSSVNKERTDGSLKVLLSYPIRRDKIVIGKLLGGVIAISIAVTASMIITFSIVMFYLSIPVTINFLIRVVLATAAGVLPLIFYFFAGIANSTVIQDASTALIGILLIFVALSRDALTVIVTFISGIFSTLGVSIDLPSLNYGQTAVQTWLTSGTRHLSMLSPTETYLSFSYSIFQFQTPGTNIPLQLDTLLYQNLDLIAVLTLYVAAGFVACFIIFTRREVA